MASFIMHASPQCVFCTLLYALDRSEDVSLASALVVSDDAEISFHFPAVLLFISNGKHSDPNPLDGLSGTPRNSVADFTICAFNLRSIATRATRGF